MEAARGPAGASSPSAPRCCGCWRVSRRTRPGAAFTGETDSSSCPASASSTVDLLLTNFHLPRSTLFMLVCAFAGTERMRRAYAHAMAGGYRFYSYGDACLLEPEGTG
jgi:S-adenosylmethionine:tRNA-ribosyltransferase-isomerase (queuine synthetase)